MSLGEPGTGTALYLPSRDFLAGKRVMDAASAAYDALGLVLEGKGIDFDIIDDEAILSGMIKDGAVVFGGAAYRHVYVPECRHMPCKVREKLAALDCRYEPEPVIRCADPAFRARMRVLNEGLLYFVYNESRGTAEAETGFPCTLTVYVLDMADGSVRQPESRICDGVTYFTMRLDSGESRAILFTEAPVKAEEVPERVLRMWPVIGFEIAKTRSFELAVSGIRSVSYTPEFRPVSLGPWEPYFGKEFSGEAVYKAVLDLGFDPRPEDVFELDLGRVDHSARVRVNSREIGVAAFSPMRLRLKDAVRILCIEIEAANTAANAYAASDVPGRWRPEDTGHYRAQTELFEKESVGGGLFGPVTLTLLG